MNKDDPQELTGAALARIPIFDREQKLWGYDIRCVAPGTGGSAGLESGLSYLASTAYIGLQKVSDRGKRLVISLDEKMIIDRFPYALPPNLALIKVRSVENASVSLIEALNGFKRDGYGIVVTNVPAEPWENPVSRLADVLCFDVSEIDRVGDSESEALPPAEPLLMAVGVSSQAALRRCHALGVSLFQGGFFKSPEEVPVRRLASSAVTRMRLLQIIEKPDPDFAEVAAAIQSDPALSYRLLSWLNSAAFGFRQTIKSIRQAIALLGWKRVRNWLRVALISDMASGPHSSELVRLAAQRGKFLEQIGERFDFWGFDPDTLQLLGIFSLLDVLLQVPMSEAVEYLPLDARLKSALEGDAASEYFPLLQLAEIFEEGKTGEAETLVSRLGLEDNLVVESFQEAVSWANQWSACGPAEPAGG